MELKIEDLKAGDILETNDLYTPDSVDGFTRILVDAGSLEIFKIDGERIYMTPSLEGTKAILEEELKYFKKKESKPEYSFNDLIDVAVQAYKDNLIGNLFISNNHIEFDRGIESFDYGTTCIENGINFIQSLYKETFVIECEEDLKRIKEDADITL